MFWVIFVASNVVPIISRVEGSLFPTNKCICLKPPFINIFPLKSEFVFYSGALRGVEGMVVFCFYRA